MQFNRGVLHKIVGLLVLVLGTTSYAEEGYEAFEWDDRSIEEKSRENWESLRALEPRLAKRLNRWVNSICPAAQSGFPEKSVAAWMKRQWPRSQEINRFGPGKDFLYWVQDHFKERERIIVADKNTRGPHPFVIEFYQFKSPARAKAVALHVDKFDCLLEYFEYRENGRTEMSSRQFELNRFSDSLPVIDRKSKLGQDAVVVGVVDLDFKIDHPELSPYLVCDARGNPVEIDLYYYSRSVNNAVSDENASSHGNHVAGIISRQDPTIAILPIAITNNVILGEGPKQVFLPRTPLMSKVLSDLASDQRQAIERAAKFGARIFNFSVNGAYRTRPSDPDVDHIDGYFAGFEKVMDERQDLLFVVAAGNTAGSLSTLGKVHPFNRSRPHVAVVAASDSRGQLADFSSYGGVADFAAPGVDISSLGRYGVDGAVSLSGTSMAAPYVARVMAKVLHRKPEWSPEKVIAFLCKNVKRTKSLFSTTRCHGYVDETTVLQALQKTQ